MGSSSCWRLKARSWRVSAVALSPAFLICSQFLCSVPGGGQFAIHQVAVAGDHGQQIIEIVRNPSGQLPNRFHFLSLPQLLLQNLLFGDVLHQRDHALLSRHLDDFRRIEADALLPALGAKGNLQVAHRAARFERLHESQAVLRRLPEIQFRGGVAHHLFSPITGHAKETVVYIQEAPVGDRRDRDRLGAGVKRLLESFFRSLAVAHVAGDGYRADDLVSRILDRRRGNGNVDSLAVLADVNALAQLNALAAFQLFEAGRQFIGLVRRDQKVSRPPQHLARGIAVNGFGAGIPADDCAVQRVEHDGIARKFNDRGQLREPLGDALAFRHRALHLFIRAHQVARPLRQPLLPLRAPGEFRLRAQKLHERPPGVVVHQKRVASLWPQRSERRTVLPDRPPLAANACIPGRRSIARRPHRAALFPDRWPPVRESSG